MQENNNNGDYLYRTDAIKIYGLTKDELEDVTCSIYKNPHSKYTSCYKYHKNDLYSALVKIIDSLEDSSRRKDKLLCKKKLLDEEISQKEKVNMMKVQVFKTVKTFLKKCNIEEKKYIKYYDDTIKKLVHEHTDANISILDTATGIYSKICQLIKSEKVINDEKVERDKREKKLSKVLLLKYNSIKYYKSAITNYKFYSFVEFADIKNIKEFNDAVLDILKIVDNIIAIDVRTEKINTTLKNNNISLSDPRCACFYKKYINGKITNEFCNDKIKNVLISIKEVELREKTIYEMIGQKYGDEQLLSLLENNKDLIEFIQYGDFSDITKIFNLICECVDVKNKKALFDAVISKYPKRKGKHELEKKFMNGDITLEEVEKKINVTGIHVNNTLDNPKVYDSYLNIISHEKYKDSREDWLMLTNPPKSSKLDKGFKYDVCDKLYDMYLDKKIKFVQIDDVDKNNLFFLKEKCRLLDFDVTNNGKKYFASRSDYYDDCNDCNDYNNSSEDEKLIKRKRKVMV